MQIHLSTNRFERLLPRCPGTAAHCRRVAAFAREIVVRLPVSWRAALTLQHGALLHHSYLDLESASLPMELKDVIAVFQNPFRSARRNTKMLADVLTMADMLDQQVERSVWEPRSGEDLWVELDTRSGLVGCAVWKAAQEALRSPRRFDTTKEWRLPVHAAAIPKVLRALRDQPDGDVRFLARLAESDPVLAGNVLSVANSAWFGRRTRVRSVTQAMAHIGADAGRRMLFALALRPLYGSALSSPLWRHSIEIAGFCESLAQLTGCLPPGEALTLGLVHDIGRVALLLPSRQISGYGRLTEHGVPLLVAEQLRLGKGHDEVGAEVLESWDFPPEMTAAVRSHHAPADCDSDLAAFLYVAEFWSGSDEDLPSARHMDASQRRLGCSIETLAKAGRSRHPITDLLRAA